jgi:hypothetical protein
MSEQKRAPDVECVKAYVRIRPTDFDSSEVILEQVEDNKIVNSDSGDMFEYGIFR